MKILVGTDIVEIGRFSKHVKFEENGKLPHFITRCYTPKEIEYCMGKKLDKARLESLAARFAAKEAVSKADAEALKAQLEGVGATVELK